jgi:hypothetical protein
MDVGSGLQQPIEDRSVLWRGALESAQESRVAVCGAEIEVKPTPRGEKSLQRGKVTLPSGEVKRSPSVLTIR